MSHARTASDAGWKPRSHVSFHCNDLVHHSSTFRGAQGPVIPMDYDLGPDTRKRRVRLSNTEHDNPRSKRARYEPLSDILNRALALEDQVNDDVFETASVVDNFDYYTDEHETRVKEEDHESIDHYGAGGIAIKGEDRDGAMAIKKEEDDDRYSPPFEFEPCHGRVTTPAMIPRPQKKNNKKNKKHGQKQSDQRVKPRNGQQKLTKAQKKAARRAAQKEATKSANPQQQPVAKQPNAQLQVSDPAQQAIDRDLRYQLRNTRKKLSETEAALKQVEAVNAQMLLLAQKHDQTTQRLDSRISALQNQLDHALRDRYL